MWVRRLEKLLQEKFFAQGFYTHFQPLYTCLTSYYGALLFLRRLFFFFFCSFSNLICWSGLWSRHIKTFNCWGFACTQSIHTYRLTDTEHSCICMAKRAAFQQRQEVRHIQRRLSRLVQITYTHGCNLLSACWTLGLSELSACWFWTIRRQGAEFAACMHINVENWVFAHCVITDCWCLSDSVCCLIYCKVCSVIIHITSQDFVLGRSFAWRMVDKWTWC